MSKVELQLRRNGVPVRTEEDSFAFGVYLYVDVGVTGRAFSLGIDFYRRVCYLVGEDLHAGYASTYRLGGL